MASAYEITKSSIGQTNPDFVLGNGLPEYLGFGRERARGVDGDVSWKVSDQLALVVGAGYIDARVVASSTASLQNTRKTLVPSTTGSLAARYSFKGALQGLSTGASVRYTSSFVRANATLSRLYEEAASRQIYSAFLSYRWRMRRLTHIVRLNGNNLFNKFYLGPDQNIGLQRQIDVSYTLNFK